MGSGPVIDFLSANHSHKHDLQYKLLVSSGHHYQPTTSLKQILSDDHRSRFCTGNDEYAGELFERLLPSPDPTDESTEEIHLTLSKAQPDARRLRVGEPSVSSSLALCTQLELQLSTDEAVSGRRANLKNPGPESVDTSWASNSVALSETEAELGPDSGVGETTKFTTCTSGSSTRTESPILQWIIARLEDWQQHLNCLPTTDTTSQHLHNVASALTQLEDEVKLIRDNLRGDKAEAAHNRVSIADGDNADSRVVAHTLIVHVSSNTCLLSFQQLCDYMKELSSWIQVSVLRDAVFFWHHRQDEKGFYMEKPDACATLPDTDITQLRCTDAYKFVNSVNRTEGETVFRVQTVFVRE